MILLIIKVFLFSFEDADKRNIVTEKDKITEEQSIRDYKSKLEDKLSFNTEKV